MPMDLADLQRRAQAARRFEVAAGDKRFTLQLPTQHEVEMAMARARGAEGTAGAEPVLLRVRRALVESAIVEWQGVTLDDLVPGAGTDPADLVPGAAALFLDNDRNAALADQLHERFITQRAARNASMEAAAKN